MAYVLVFRRYAPFAQFGGGFEGDNRTSPSVSMTATARTIGSVPFDRGSTGTVSGSSSGSEYLGAGDWVRRHLGRHFSAVSTSLSLSRATSDTVSFTASTAGANPMVPAAPTIDTFVDFSAQWIASTIRFEGTVRGDNFPNCEVFVLDAAGTGCLLFDGRTTGGQTSGPMTRLAGSHDTQILGRFSLAIVIDASGGFAAPYLACPATTM